MTRELSVNRDKATAIQKMLGCLLSRPQSISSISEVHWLIRLFEFSALLAALAEALV